MKLTYLTHDSRLDGRLAALVDVLEMIFPERIRAYYLSGSVLSGTMVGQSDIDVIAVFKGAFADGEAERVRQVRRWLTELSDVRYDIVPRCETDLMRAGATGLKLATALLYGEDVREQVPLEPLEVFLHDVVAGFVAYGCELRGDMAQLNYPVRCPDAADFFYGYTRFGNWDGKNYAAGTRIILSCITLGATAQVLMETGERCTGKQQAVQRYQEVIGGRWGDWLVEMFELCKLKWGYALPETAAERGRLRKLLGEMENYETEILVACREVITAADDIAVDWGEQ